MLTRNACQICQGNCLQNLCVCCLLILQLSATPPLHPHIQSLNRWVGMRPQIQILLRTHFEAHVDFYHRFRPALYLSWGKLRINEGWWTQKHRQWQGLHSNPGLPMLSWMALLSHFSTSFQVKRGLLTWCCLFYTMFCLIAKKKNDF